MSEVGDIVDILVDAIDEILGIDAENAEIIDNVVTKTEDELQFCEEVIDNIKFMNNAVQKEIIPSVETKMNEIKRMFTAVDVMERTVIPSLLADLEVIESIMDNIERKITKANQKTPSKSIWDRVGLTRAISDPNTKNSPTKKRPEDDFIPSDFPLHDQALILDEISSAIASASTSTQSVDR